MGVDSLNIEGLKAPEHQGPIVMLNLMRFSGRHCEPTGRRNAPPDDRLREAIHEAEDDFGLLRRAASRNDVEMIG